MLANKLDCSLQCWILSFYYPFDWKIDHFVVKMNLWYWLLCFSFLCKYFSELRFILMCIEFCGNNLVAEWRVLWNFLIKTSKVMGLVLIPNYFGSILKHIETQVLMIWMKVYFSNFKNPKFIMVSFLMSICKQTRTIFLVHPKICQPAKSSIFSKGLFREYFVKKIWFLNGKLLFT